MIDRIERLEDRRLLSLTPIGPVTDIPGEGAFDLAVAANGNSIIARVTDPLASTHTLELLRFDATGAQVGSPITVATGAHIQHPSISMDADGDAVVTFSNNGVYVARVTKAGVASVPVGVANDGEQPDVSVDSVGGYFLAWTAPNTTTGDFELRVQAFDKTGISRAPAFKALSVFDISGAISPLQIDTNADGTSAVVAAGEYFEGGRDNVAFAIVSQTALVSSADVIAVHLNKANPAVAMNADGSFEIGYTTYDKIGGTGGDPVSLSILVQRFNSTGTTIGSPIVLRDSSEDADIPKDILHTPEGNISIDATADGGFIAVYSRVLFTGVETLTTPIFVQSFDATGVADPDGPLTLVNSGNREEIGIDSAGNAQVVFSPLESTGPLQLMRVSTTSDFAFVQDGLLSVAGTAGDDSISVDLSGANIVVTRGAETRSFAAATVNVVQIDGFDGNDTITNNTSLKTTLRGGAGSDTIFGGTGEDRLHGGIGNDSLWGGNGPDKIFGEDGVDSLYGNGGNDRIEGGAQHDHIRGNAGHDMLFGNGGNDELFGGADADRLYGQAGTDVLWGEGGNDRLYGDDGFADILHGGAGNDVFITLDGAIDQLFGDGGRDASNADANDVLTSIEAAAAT